MTVLNLWEPSFSPPRRFDGSVCSSCWMPSESCCPLISLPSFSCYVYSSFSLLFFFSFLHSFEPQFAPLNIPRSSQNFARRSQRSLYLCQPIRIGTWNVQTLQRTRHASFLLHELSQYNISITSGGPKRQQRAVWRCSCYVKTCSEMPHWMDPYR